MSSHTLSDTRSHLTELVDEARFKLKRIIITKNGKPAAAIVSLEDIQLLEQYENQLDIEAARYAKKLADQEGTIAWKVAKKELEL